MSDSLRTGVAADASSDAVVSTSAPPITIGRLADFARDPLATLHQLYEAHGPLAAFDDGAVRVVLAFAPEHVQRVLTDTSLFHAKFFPLRGPKKSAQRRLTGGLLTMNREEHRGQRRMLMQPFQRRAFPDHLPAIQALTKELVDRWKPGAVVDLHAEMNEYMLRVVSSILFGFQDPQRAFELGRMLHSWLELNNLIGIAALAPVDGLPNRYEELLAEAEHFEDALLQFISDRSPESLAEQNDILSILLGLEADGRVTREQLIGHTALIFGASHLTTAHTLTWMQFLLSQHPEALAQVREELAIQPTTDATQDNPQSALSRVIRESMRVLPASSYSVRATTEATRMGPLELSAGTTVLFCQLITHRMRELWDSPRKFIPDRWKTISPSPYAYFPFGTGPRMCVGGPLALVIIRTALPMILRKFSMTSVPGSEVNASVISTMLAPTTPVWMKLGLPDAPPQAVPVGGNIHRLVDLPR